MRAGHSVFYGGGDMGARMRAHDWASTPLGPVETWPAALETLVGVLLGAKQPMFVAWGPSLTLLYNDNYRLLLGSKDRAALGRPFYDVWAEIRDDLVPLVDRTLSGEPVHMDDIMLIVDREGVAPEAHFAFSYTPVRDDDGVIGGLLCACAETTEQVNAARRQGFRLELEEALRSLEHADVIIETAAVALGRHLRANRVGYGEMSEDGQGVVLTSGYLDGVAPLAGSFDLDAFGKTYVDPQRRGRTMVVPDVRDSADTDPTLWETMNIRAFVSAPILRAGRLKVMLYVNQAVPRAWSPDEVGLIEAVASRVSEAVERLRAEQASRASEARFRTLTQAIPIQVWTATPDGTLDWANDRTFEFSGAADVTFDGLGWSALVHADDLPTAGARWGASLASGAIYEVEFRIRRADGIYRWHLVRAVPQYGTDGAILRWVGTNTDIDDKKRTEIDLSAAKLLAEEANLAKSNFIANMSHELRTPLSAIIGYAEMMAEEIDDGTQAADLAPDIGKIEVNARHLLGLINGVLDLSKVESGKMEVYAETFAVGPMLHDLANTVGSLVAKKANTLALRVPPDLGTMNSDLTKVRQVLLNFLGNAAKFSENGTITLAATRAIGDDGLDCIRFDVVDTGIGMTDAQLGKLFQRFQQADSSTTRKFGGTGLGLSLAKAFADMLCGQVRVVSTPGVGSTFSFIVPATYVAAADDGASIEIAAADPQSALDLVLVIDDDADQRQLMSRFLQRENFRVQVAADGREGLDLARRLRPRAILLDVMMPGIDGWSVLTELKADPALAETPVVMVTAFDHRGLARSLGAADYMLKPIQWDRFSQVMDRFRTPEGGIFLVEDDADTRQRVGSILQEAGWSVAEACDGSDGLRRVAERRPAVVLLDLTMPVMDGFDFLDSLRAMPGCGEIPVVVLTARDLTREDRHRLRGASQILNKGDISLRSLVERLHHLADPRLADA